MTTTEARSTRTIELDCPPGIIRPWHLIVGVCEGTGLTVTSEPVPCFFGHASWSFEATDAEWEKVQTLVAPRIERLYHAGTIRYGSW